MKKALAAMLLLAVAATGASGQDVKIDRQPAMGRVAVVNISLVVEKSGKAIDAANLVTTMKEIQAAIRTVAYENRIDAVYGYRDPLAAEEMDRFPNVNRKMQAMDLGATVPLVLAPHADISMEVIDVLGKGKRVNGIRLGTNRVAIHNIGYAFNQYKKAPNFKAVLEQDLLPYKREGKKLGDEIEAWQKAIQLGKTEDENGVSLDSKIAQAKQRLKEIKTAVDRVLGKRQEENLVRLWTEIQAGVKSYAKVHGIELVLEYGDPMDKQLLDQFPNVTRKMLAMDLGSTVPLCFSPKRDISDGVAHLLNTAIEPNMTQIHVTKVAYFFDLSVSFAKPNQSPVAVEKVKDLLAPARTRTANIGLVFNKYEKAQQFKRDLENALAPYREKGKKLTDEIKDYEVEIKNGGSEKQLRAAIKKHKRELEDMSAEIASEFGKKQEDNLVTLWKEVQAGIRTYAAENNVDVVLGYGDPMNKEILDQFPNVNRKMDAMDLGGGVSLFVRPRVEIGDAVAELLNKQYRAIQK